MHIYTAPDRTQYPPNFQSRTSPELEVLTGADMCISPFPLPITSGTLQRHIESRALFVQIKIGYDILSFDALHNFCARTQAQKIPKQQAILLRIGEYWQDENNLFRVRGNKPYGKTDWRQYRRMLMSNMARGITIFPECLTSIDQLPEWIEDYTAVLDKIDKEGTRELYPIKQEFILPQEDVWQPVIAIEPTDPRAILVSGLPGFGAVKAQNTYEYICTHYTHLHKSFVTVELNEHQECAATILHFLKVLTDENVKGKAVHNVPQIGNKTRKDLRQWLGLPNGFNIDIREINHDLEQPRYRAGFEMALDVFEHTMNELTKANGGKLSPQIINEAFEATKKQVDILIEF